MKKFYSIITLKLILSVSNAAAQSLIQIYYDNEWKITSKDKYEFKREAMFDFKNVCFNGEFKDYDKESHLIGRGNYTKGIKTGIHLTFFSDGTLKSTIEYTDNQFVIHELLDNKKNVLVKDGTGKFTLPCVLNHPNWNAGRIAGQFLNSKKDGQWVFYDVNEKVVFEAFYVQDVYQNGSPLEVSLLPNKIIESFETGSTERNLYNYFSSQTNSNDSITVSPRIPYGVPGLMKEMGKNIRYPKGRHDLKGIVIIKLSIDKEGVVKDYSIIKSAHKLLDEEALKTVKLLEHRWFPAMLKGQSYDSYTSVPVKFEVLNLGPR